MYYQNQTKSGIPTGGGLFTICLTGKTNLFDLLILKDLFAFFREKPITIANVPTIAGVTATAGIPAFTSKSLLL